MNLSKPRLFAATLFVAIAGGAGSAGAEVTEITYARQQGLSYLPMIVMEHFQLIEKHAKLQGLTGVKGKLVSFPQTTGITDAMLAGNLHFATQGTPSLLTLWDKTVGTGREIRAVCAVTSSPEFLNTRNPNVKTLKDFTANDKIALPGAKVAIQAIVLQMAAEQAFGRGEHARLDSLTVTMSHADAFAAIMGTTSEVNSHFTNVPYQYYELENPAIHRVLNSFDVLGGPHSVIHVYTTVKFRTENPKSYAAFYGALREASDIISKDKKAAAQAYLDISKDKTPLDAIVKLLNDPDQEYGCAPRKVMKFVDFMYRIGSIKHMPASWKDLYFPEVHNMQGD
jgi:NitT/TauT family transport system substrate-binding protein